MDLVELYFENADGQMEINFDSLEMKTTKRFAENVRIGVGNQIIKKVIVDDFDYLISLTILTDLYVHKFTYSREEKIYFNSSISLTDLERLDVLKEGVE